MKFRTWYGRNRQGETNWTEQKKKANMDSRVSTGSDLDHVNSISSWITYDFSAICRRSLKILCIKKYCSICTAASESLHLSALLSPLLLLVDFLRCGRVFCHKPGPEEVHPEQVHSTSWSLPHTHKDWAQSVGIREEGGKKQDIICGAARESYIIRINCKVEILRNLNWTINQFCRLFTVRDLQMKSYFLYYVRVCFQTRTGLVLQGQTSNSQVPDATFWVPPTETCS